MIPTTVIEVAILIGGSAFAATGALAALRRDMDIFGAIVLAVVTAVGGGTLRDLILGNEIFWIQQPIHLIVAIVTGAATFFASGLLQRPMLLLLLADGLGLALAAVASAKLAMDHQGSYTVAVFIGVIASTAGGIIRDTICGQVPLIFQREVYATAAMIGALMLVLAHAAGRSGPAAELVATGVAFAIRTLAIVFSLSLPRVLRSAPSSPPKPDPVPSKLRK